VRAYFETRGCHFCSCGHGRAGKIPMAIFKKPAIKAQNRKKRDIPHGLFQKCPGCSEVVPEIELAQNQRVCPRCDYHFSQSARERIENLLEALPSVKQAILLGDRQPYISALLVVDPNRLQAAMPDSNGDGTGHLASNAYREIYQKLGRELKLVNSQLERVEQIVRFAVFHKPFPSETYAMVGPGKARRTRGKIEEVFAPQIQELYHASEQMDSSFVPGMDRRLRPSSDLRVHLVWLAKDHKSLVRGEVAVYLKPIIKELCRRMNVQILSGNISPDHVHLFISYPPDLSVSGIVSNLKRSTSSKVFHDHPKLQEEAMAKNLWEQGYLAVTSGNLSDEVLQRYLMANEEESIPFAPTDASSIVIPMPELY